MEYELTTEEFFRRHGYGLNTNVEEALAIRLKHPKASNIEIAKMNVSSKRDQFAREGNWGMYAVTVSNFQTIYEMSGDYEQALECLLQVFYITLSEGRQYTPYMIECISKTAEKCGFDTPAVLEKYQSSINMLPSALLPVPASTFQERLRSDLADRPGIVKALSPDTDLSGMNGYFLLDCIEETEKSGASPSFLISLLNVAEDKNVSANTKARICKKRGELLQEGGDDEGALISFKKALEYASGTPVKRKIASLEKKLGKTI